MSARISVHCTADRVLCGCFQCVSNFFFLSFCGSNCVCTYISLSISSCEYLRVYCVHKTYKFIAYEFCHLFFFWFGEQFQISFFPVVLSLLPRLLRLVCSLSLFLIVQYSLILIMMHFACKVVKHESKTDKPEYSSIHIHNTHTQLNSTQGGLVLFIYILHCIQNYRKSDNKFIWPNKIVCTLHLHIVTIYRHMGERKEATKYV